MNDNLYNSESEKIMYSQILRKAKFLNESVYVYSHVPRDFGLNMIERKWGDWTAVSEYEKHIAVKFILHTLSRVPAFPNFIKDLPNLKALELPIDFVENVQFCNIAPKLQALTLYEACNMDFQYQWNEEIVLEKLLYLSVPELLYSFKVPYHCFPNIEWIDYDLQSDKKGQALDNLGQFKNLNHLSFSHAKNLDIFTPFKDKTIESLFIFAATGKTFPIEKICYLKSLKHLVINNIKVPFDCSLLRELPNLVELRLWNVSTILNREVLSEICASIEIE